YEQICGFGEYGFPESHAASFALLAYVSAWLKCYHPAAFCAALINSQPMGFYAPAQLVSDARRHGVELRPVDVNFSGWDCTFEPAGSRQQAAGSKGISSSLPAAGCRLPALRLGFRLIRGLAQAHADAIVAVRAERPFTSFTDFVRRTGLRAGALKKLGQ